MCFVLNCSAVRTSSNTISSPRSNFSLSSCAVIVTANPFSLLLITLAAPMIGSMGVENGGAYPKSMLNISSSFAPKEIAEATTSMRFTTSPCPMACAPKMRLVLASTMSLI